MKQLSEAQLAARKKRAKESSYVKRVWVTDKDSIMTLDEYAKYIDATFKYVSGNPVIIAKPKKKGGYFLKMEIPLKGGSIVEYELSYNSENCDFEEDDIIDVNTLRFCTEECLGQDAHDYVTGDILE